MAEEPVSAGHSRSLAEAIAAFRDNDLNEQRVARLSDLSRDDARVLTETWESIPESVRADLIRRCDELSEVRVELNFGRALRIALQDHSAAVRQLAIAAMWEDESRDLLDRLRAMLSGDPSPDVRAEAAAALERFARQAALGEIGGEIGEELREELLQAAADDETPYAVRRRALEALGPFAAAPRAARFIFEAYDSGDHGLQCSAIYAMGRSLDSRWLPHVLAELENDEPELQFEAARAAGALGSPDALPLLLEAARSDDAEVRHAAIAALGQIGGRGAARALERLAEDAGEADLELIESALDEVNLSIEPFQPAT
jgi:HEAT repeat protein